MLTSKQQKSMDHVAEVFRYFYSHSAFKDFYCHDIEQAQLAVKLTQVYFDNHYPDGTPCDSEDVSE